MDTDHVVAAPWAFVGQPIDSSESDGPIEDFPTEVLVELRRIVEELNNINVRLSVIDTIKIPGWLRK